MCSAMNNEPVTTVFEFKTRKGLAEGAVTYAYGKRTMLDRLLGRDRLNFGVGLCSPRDRNEKKVVGFDSLGYVNAIRAGRLDTNFNDYNIFGEPLYIPGKTEKVAAGRFKVQAESPRERANETGFMGSFTVKKGTQPRWTQLRDLVLAATPTGWWDKAGKPWSADCGLGNDF